MAASAYGKRVVKQTFSKEAKMYVEAYETVLAAAGIEAEFKLGDVTATSARGVEKHSGSISLKWAKPDEKRKRLATDTMVLELVNGVLVDLEDARLHRVTRKDMQTALEQSLQEILKAADEPTPLYKEADACLKRFYPNRQELQPCLTLIGQSCFTSRKVYIRAAFEPKDMLTELMEGRKALASARGVSIQLSVTTKAVPVAARLFKSLKVYGVSKTPEEQNAQYLALCTNPKVSPTEVYNAMLASAFVDPPTVPAATQALQAVLAMNRF